MIEYSYQMDTICQILDAIINETEYDGGTDSVIADILLSILNATPYTGEEPTSVIGQLFLRLKAKIEGDTPEPFDDPAESEIAQILLSILNDTEYTEEPRSNIAEKLLELKEKLE